MVDGHRREVVADCTLDARLIAGLDTPDQAPHDSCRRHFRLEAPDLPIIFAVNRIEREPGHGGRTVMCAGRDSASANHAGQRMLADGKVHDIVAVAGGPDPCLGDSRRRPRGDRFFAQEQAGKSTRERLDHLGDRRRVRVQRRHAERSRHQVRGGNLAEHVGRRCHRIGGTGLCACDDLPAIVNEHRDSGRISNFETEHGIRQCYVSPVQSVCSCSLRPASGTLSMPASSRRNSARSIRDNSNISCRSSGALMTITPLVCSGGKRRSSR